MPDNDRYAEIFRNALRRRADGAPRGQSLAARARARLARRRRRQVAGATIASVAVIAGVIGIGQLGGGGPDDGGRDVAQDPRRQAAEPPRDGWRWESYGGIEVAVPDDWGYGVTGHPPCLDPVMAQPYVGRPGVVPSILCPGTLPPLSERMPYLWFDSPEPEGGSDHDGGWTLETRTVDQVKVTVLSDDAELRREILDSARAIDRTDSHGCSVTHPVTDGPGERPSSVDGGLDTVGDVDSISVCRYALGEDRLVDRPLVSSSRITGTDADDLVDALLAAPAGSGPDTPEQCVASVRHGDEVMVLRLHGGAHSQEVHVRYSGCVENGTDDGATGRELTGSVLRQLIRPRLIGANGPMVMSAAVHSLL